MHAEAAPACSPVTPGAVSGGGELSEAANAATRSCGTLALNDAAHKYGAPMAGGFVHENGQQMYTTSGGTPPHIEIELSSRHDSGRRHPDLLGVGKEHVPSGNVVRTLESRRR
ncbi:hypothetical protein GCM10009753_48370 [Streptantibioticus ferralitis]